MTTKQKGRNGGDRPTPKTSDNRKRTAIRSRIKAGIVRLAVWGVVPVDFASWLIRRGGLTDA
jgi:hypothetical protein